MKDKKYVEEAVKYMERHKHHPTDDEAKINCKVCQEDFANIWKGISETTIKIEP